MDRRTSFLKNIGDAALQHFDRITYLEPAETTVDKIQNDDSLQMAKKTKPRSYNIVFDWFYVDKMAAYTKKP